MKCMFPHCKCNLENNGGHICPEGLEEEHRPYEIQDYALDDPVPDVFNQCSVGTIAHTSDGRRWARQEDYTWKPA